MQKLSGVGVPGKQQWICHNEVLRPNNCGRTSKLVLLLLLLFFFYSARPSWWCHFQPETFRKTICSVVGHKAAYPVNVARLSHTTSCQCFKITDSTWTHRPFRVCHRGDLMLQPLCVDAGLYLQLHCLGIAPSKPKCRPNTSPYRYCLPMCVFPNNISLCIFISPSIRF